MLTVHRLECSLEGLDAVLENVDQGLQGKDQLPQHTSQPRNDLEERYFTLLILVE